MSIYDKKLPIERARTGKGPALKGTMVVEVPSPKDQAVRFTILLEDRSKVVYHIPRAEWLALLKDAHAAAGL